MIESIKRVPYSCIRVEHAFRRAGRRGPNGPALVAEVMELLPQRLNRSRKESSQQKVPVARRFMKARTTCVGCTPDRRGLVLVAVAKSPQHRRSGHHSRAVNTTALPVEARQGGFPFTPLCAQSDPLHSNGERRE